MDIQTNKSEYKKQSLVSEFFRSCLGKTIIMVVAMGVILLVANITVPQEKQMMEGTLNGVYKCIKESHGHEGDASDDIVRNGIATFDHETDSLKKDSVLEDFHRFNNVEVYKHKFFATAYIISNFNSRGARAAVGVFGVVIPTVNFKDFVLRNGPIRKDYNQRIIKQTISSDTYMGDNPDLGNTYNTYGD
ncbi:MAG: hypothetical protein SOZ58_07735 [Prevotella sp.]|nr:hypothetical protein [Prevotella sp.]